VYSAEQKGKEAKGTDARERANLFSIAAHGAFLPNVWRAAPCHPPPDPLYGLLLCEVLPSMPAEAGGEEVNGMPERHMLLHLLPPNVKCPTCDSDLVFVRVRGNCDLYHCASGVCKCEVMHHLNRATRTCGWAVIYYDGAFGEWTACEKPAAKG
jgi:hypothetical protein